MGHVICRDKKTGEFVAEYESYVSAARALRLRTPSNIAKAANGALHSAYGYTWEKVGEDGHPKIKPQKAFGKRKAIKLLKRFHEKQSWQYLSEATGWSIEDLRRLYDEKKLYRSA